MTQKEIMEKSLKDKGFVVESTGGNCEAYIKYLKDGRYWMITERECGVCLPTDLNTLVACGFYNAEGDDWIDIHPEYEKDNEEGCLLSELLNEHDFS